MELAEQLIIRLLVIRLAFQLSVIKLVFVQVQALSRLVEVLRPLEEGEVVSQPFIPLS